VIWSHRKICPNSPHQNKNAHWSSDWKGVFTQDLWGRNMFEPGSHLSYRPLTTISFRFNHYFHELRPFGYHVVNVALHVAVTVLFTLVVRRMLFSTFTSVLAGALFAVHPLHVEVATNIVGRAESLSGTQYSYLPVPFSPNSLTLHQQYFSSSLFYSSCPSLPPPAPAGPAYSVLGCACASGCSARSSASRLWAFVLFGKSSDFCKNGVFKRKRQLQPPPPPSLRPLFPVCGVCLLVHC
jgi:hypothetical protein